jgi:hypothetical protein
MKKLKLIALGVSLMSMAAIGVSYFGATAADAQSSGEFQCQWNGFDCNEPLDKNTCGCESNTPVVQ